MENSLDETFTIFIIYLFFMLGMDSFLPQEWIEKEDYYAGKREMSAGHIRLSVVATDVGGFQLD